MDAAIFRAFQNLVGFSQFTDGVLIFLATYLIWIETAAFLGFWLIRRRKRLLAALGTGTGALLGWAVARWIGAVCFRPRPFYSLPGVHELIAKSMGDKSFPSDHSTIAFAVALGVYLADRRYGAALLAMAALVALGRVAVGVHYPSDAAAGAALGIASAWAVHKIIHSALSTEHRAK